MDKISLGDKYLLSIPAAAEYFNVGVKRIRKIAEDNEGNFTFVMGPKHLIIRHKLEEWFEWKEVKKNHETVNSL